MVFIFDEGFIFKIISANMLCALEIIYVLGISSAIVRVIDYYSDIFLYQNILMKKTIQVPDKKSYLERIRKIQLQV